jgi:ApaG protein
MYSLTTHEIKVSVTPYYLESQSMPSEQQYAWAYQIQIKNEGKEKVQLINRHWIITDANGMTSEVTGPGVVGEQPIIHPNAEHEYTSGVTLNTQSGLMTGTYEMIIVNEEDTIAKTFKIDIPAFSLDTPEQLAKPN